MTYTPLRGAYGTVSTSGLAGFFIQLGTFSKQNHAFIYIGEGNPLGNIIEATPHGVKYGWTSEYTNILWNKWDELTDAQRDLIVETAKAHLGDPYFWRVIVVIGFRILHLPAGWLSWGMKHNKSVICSELVTICYRAAGVNVVPEKPVWLVTPSDLMYRLLFL